MMIRGRHRALPYALDRAIMMPSERLDTDSRSEMGFSSARNPSSMLPMKMHHIIQADEKDLELRRIQ